MAVGKKYAIDFKMSDGSTKTVEFEVPLAELVGALMRDGTTPMEANLPMGSFRVTGVGAPEADGDAVNRKYVLDNFRPSNWTPTAADVGAVPTSRKVNGKALSADITLGAEDVGARPNTWMPSASDVGAVAKTALKTLAYSQTDSNGDTTYSVLSAYPTTPGVYRVGGTVFSGLPSDAIGYGTLVIFDAGGYFMHLYRDGNSHFYIGRTADGVKIPTAESWKRCFDSDDVIPVANGGTGANTKAEILKSLHSEYPVTANIATFGSGYENGGHCTPTDLKKAMGIHENFRVYHIDTSMSNPYSSISANWSTILGGPFMLTLKFVGGSTYAYVGYKIDANNGALIELSFGSGAIYKYTVQNGTWTEFAHSV